MAASSSLGSTRSCMEVNPSAFANSRLASEYEARMPSFGFQLGTRARCARAAAVAEIAVSTLRRVIVTKRKYCESGFVSKGLRGPNPVFALLETHAPHQIAEPRFRAQSIEHRIHFQIDQPGRAVVEGLLHP